MVMPLFPSDSSRLERIKNVSTGEREETGRGDVEEGSQELISLRGGVD